MRRKLRARLPGWGWAAVGAVAVILLAFGTTSVITALKQHADEGRIQRIERIVVHRHHGSSPHRAVHRGVMPSTPHTGSSQPGPHPGGSTGGNGEGDHGGGSTNPPVPSAPEPPSHRESATGPERVESPSSPSIPEVVHEHIPPTETATAPIGEAVGGVLEETGETVNGTVGGVTETVCTLTKLLCP